MARTIKSQELARLGKARQRCGALFLIAFLFSSGCSSKKVPRLDAATVLRVALAKSMTLKSYHFTSRTQVSSAADAGKTVNVSGDWRRPDRLSLIITTDGLRQEMIVIGNVAYYRRPGSKAWKSSDASPEIRNQGIQSTLRTLRSFRDVKLDGDAVIDGTPAKHARARYDLSVFAGKQAGNAGVAADIWISKKSGYIIRMDIKSDKEPTPAPIKLEINVALDRFNRVGRIAPPVAK